MTIADPVVQGNFFDPEWYRDGDPGETLTLAFPPVVKAPPPLFVPKQQTGQAFVLFDDQREAVDAIKGAYAEGEKSVIISEPTGAGKTISALFAMMELGFRQTVFLVHRDELVKQTLQKAQLVAPGISVGIVKAGLNELGADLTIASAQTLAHKNRLEKLCASLGDDVLLFVDECHHAVARTWLESIKQIGARYTIGMTATAYRADGKALSDAFGKIVHHTPLLVLIAQKRLKMPVGVRIVTGVDIDAVGTSHGDFNEGQLDDAIDTESRNQLIVDAWRDHRDHKGQHFERPVAFCVTVKHAEHLRDKFRENGYPCEMVVGTTSSDERDRIYEEFRLGHTYMTSVGVLTEGWDEPKADAVLMCRPTKSLGLWVQMVGRVLRESMGLEFALVLDFVDATTRHSLVTLPTLAGIEAEGDADGAEGEEDDREIGEQIDFMDMVQRIVKVRKLKALPVNLFGGSAYLWRESEGLWWTSTGAVGSYLTMVPDEGGLFRPLEIWPAIDEYDKPTTKSLFDRPVELSMAKNLAEALVPKNRLTEREAAWRALLATRGQLGLARAEGNHIPRALEATLTRGEASEMIDRAKFIRAARALRFIR